MTDIHTLVVDRTEIEFDHPVMDTLCVEGAVVVVLDVMDPDLTMTDNAVGFSTDGEQRWRIAELPDPYVGVFERDGDVWLRSYGCANHRIDPDTGEILEKEQTI